jgi:hypothetical protein
VILLRGRLIPFEVLETFSSSLELVYRELLVKDSLYGLTAEESEACGLIRCCLVTFQAMCDKWYMQENRPSRQLATYQTQGYLGRPRFVIHSEQLSVLLEHRFRCSPDRRHVWSFYQHYPSTNVRLWPFCWCNVH